MNVVDFQQLVLNVHPSTLEQAKRIVTAYVDQNKELIVLDIAFDPFHLHRLPSSLNRYLLQLKGEDVKNLRLWLEATYRLVLRIAVFDAEHEGFVLMTQQVPKEEEEVEKCSDGDSDLEDNEPTGSN